MCPPAQNQAGFTEIQKIRCVLVHDHVLLLHGLRRLLEDEPDLEVVAEAGNVAEALACVREHQPEIVIADAHMFEFAADQTEWLILQEAPKSKVLFLTMRSDTAQHARREISCAVRQTTAEELVEMVRRVHSGETTAPRDIARAQSESGSEKLGARKRLLTAREREVVKLLAEGRTVRSTAGILGLSVKTVDAHKFNLMRKLGLHNKAELVMWAIQKRVVKVPAGI